MVPQVSSSFLTLERYKKCPYLLTYLQGGFIFLDSKLGHRTESPDGQTGVLADTETGFISSTVRGDEIISQ